MFPKAVLGAKMLSRESKNKKGAINTDVNGPVKWHS